MIEFTEILRPAREEEAAFETERLRLSVLNKRAAERVATYYASNREFHKKWSQKLDDSYYTKKIQAEYLADEIKTYYRGKIVPFFITLKDSPDNEIIGRVSYFNIVGGGMMSCLIGYSLSEKYLGKGYMTEAVKATSKFMMNQYKIHRIEALIKPDNIKSENVIKRCGFEFEGVRKSCMYIDREWADHNVYYLLEK